MIVSLFSSTAFSQKTKNTNLVYVDKQGVLRYTATKQEAAFFGVNYTTPFAFAYRAHKALNVDIEKAIQQDVYHMARLGLDAFRVHVWDTEISDTVGNLLENEHLRLFDFLLAELKKRNIKTIITPIAFWGNGYPERDETTPGFARKYGKGRSTTNDTAIKAQENYLQQFFKHVNPYTKLTYGNDPDVIAVEINNEPSHSGPKPGVTDYINRLAAAIRSTGWTKPVYYNISQNPWYADAVAKAKIDGVSFQWYPTGLVANQEVKGNFLPNVDHYHIPFDTIPEFRNKSRMVYEFDAADVLQSNMYPVMAKSYREAGFQWATQFAYDPMAIANVNTEYQTHYLNLAYTPSKAISLMIASEVFHNVPRLKNYGSYPADSVFDRFRVSYKNSSSELNSEDKFYYSNSTSATPVNSAKLSSIAGVGNSPVVQYTGTGAYFLDKLNKSIWRLEVMPDVVYIRDPFERASPNKTVTHIEWRTQTMTLAIPGLEQFTLIPLNEGNKTTITVKGTSFDITPGTYQITVPNPTIKETNKISSGVGMNEFFAPASVDAAPYVTHTPFTEVSANTAFTVHSKIIAIKEGDKVRLEVNRTGGGRPLSVDMKEISAYNYTAEVPASYCTPGELQYRIIIQTTKNEYIVFPGNHSGNPYAWDNYINETWKTYVAAEKSKLEIYNPTTDKSIALVPNFQRGFQTSYIAGTEPKQLLLRLSATDLPGDHIMGFRFYFGDKVQGRKTETFDKLFIRAATGDAQPLKTKIILTNADGLSFSTFITLTNTQQDIEIPLNNVTADSSLLLPRPYPGFQSLWFKGDGTATFKLSDIISIQVLAGPSLPASEFSKPHSLEVQSLWLQKSN